MACHAPVMSDTITARAPDACSTTEGQWHRDDQNPREVLPWLAEGMRRRRSIPDVGRQKLADALRRRSLVGFPPGDDVEPRQPPVTAPIYLFASARVGTATTGPVPRPAEAVHTSTAEAEDNNTCIRQQLPVPHLVSQRSFARPRARPGSSPPTCANDEDYLVHGLLKDHVTLKFPQHACLHSASCPKP